MVICRSNNSVLKLEDFNLWGGVHIPFGEASELAEKILALRKIVQDSGSCSYLRHFT
jgi:hypothetical protein